MRKRRTRAARCSPLPGVSVLFLFSVRDAFGVSGWFGGVSRNPGVFACLEGVTLVASSPVERPKEAHETKGVKREAANQGDSISRSTLDVQKPTKTTHVAFQPAAFRYPSYLTTMDCVLLLALFLFWDKETGGDCLAFFCLSLAFGNIQGGLGVGTCNTTPLRLPQDGAVKRRLACALCSSPPRIDTTHNALGRIYHFFFVERTHHGSGWSWLEPSQGLHGCWQFLFSRRAEFGRSLVCND